MSGRSGHLPIVSQAGKVLNLVLKTEQIH